MGRIVAPFGIKGWVKIHVETAQIDSLSEYPFWWISSKDKNAGWRQVKPAETRPHGEYLAARLEGVVERDAALALKGLEVAVQRADMPKPAQGEFYWTDLIGLKVVNRDRHGFGQVASLIATGANDVLVVQQDKDGDKRETLIPFIAGVIDTVDLAAGEIVVDWGADY